MDNIKEKNLSILSLSFIKGYSNIFCKVNNKNFIKDKKIIFRLVKRRASTSSVKKSVIDVIGSVTLIELNYRKYYTISLSFTKKDKLSIFYFEEDIGLEYSHFKNKAAGIVNNHLLIHNAFEFVIENNEL